MSQMSGNGFKTGAISAGLNEALQKELGKISDPLLHQAVSALVGETAAKIIGGNGKVGAAAALYATKYNWLDHKQQIALLDDLKRAGEDKEQRKRVYAFYAALSQYNYDHYGATEEAIELNELLGQIQNDTDYKEQGLNAVLNEISISIFGMQDLANYYRAQLESYSGYNSQFSYFSNTEFDFSAGKRTDISITNTVDNIFRNGGYWSQEGILIKGNGTTTGINRGDYEYEHGAKAYLDYSTGRYVVKTSDGDYVIWGKKSKGDELVAQGSLVVNGKNGDWYALDENGKPWYASSISNGNKIVSEEYMNAMLAVKNSKTTTETLSKFKDFLIIRTKEGLENYKEKQYEMALSLGMGSELAGVAAEMTTDTLVIETTVGPVLESASVAAKVLSQNGAKAGVEVVEGSSKAVLGKDELVVADKSFLNEKGRIDWDKYAPNGGYVEGTRVDGVTLKEGTLIDRYGSPKGSYTSPVGVSYEARALPYTENPNAYHQYRIIKPIENVSMGEIAPAFKQPGGGIQYELPNSIEYLIDKKYLEVIN